jgi:NAD-dependent dihydropyrimidine dehydrogenase PreA subunit
MWRNKMPKIEIDHTKCDGKECAECVDSCPMSIFKLENDGIAVGSGAECTLCELCQDLCPSSAINISE